jgi:NAD-dependent dihydropyrimidine dehydrogenase PreA subunit
MALTTDRYLEVATKDERSYLAGEGKDIYSDSYKWNRSQMLITIRKRYEREHAEECRLRKLMGTGDREYIEFGRQLLEYHTRKCGYTVVYDARTDPRNGSVRHDVKRITIPPIDASGDLELARFQLATFAHETGHAINGPCPGTPPHLPVRHESCRSCKECETRASTTALKLIPFEHLAMAADLEKSLKSHEARTPGTLESDKHATRYGHVWRADFARRMAHEIRMMRYQQMRELAREAREAAR